MDAILAPIVCKIQNLWTYITQLRNTNHALFPGAFMLFSVSLFIEERRTHIRKYSEYSSNLKAKIPRCKENKTMYQEPVHIKERSFSCFGHE